MAHHYQVDTLKRICGEFVIASISPHTVSRFLVSAARYQEQNVHRACTEYILKSASAVMSTPAFVSDMTSDELEKLLANDRLGSISEAALFERVVKWARGQLARADDPDGTGAASAAAATMGGAPDPRLKKLLHPLLKHIRYEFTPYHPLCLC